MDELSDAEFLAGENLVTELRKEKSSEESCSHIFCGILHSRVYICESGNKIEVKNRIKVQRFYNANCPETSVPAKKIHGSDIHFCKNCIDNAVMSEYLLESESSDERRQNHRQHCRNMAQAFSGKIECVVKKSHRHGDKEYKKRCNSRNFT